MAIGELSPQWAVRDSRDFGIGNVAGLRSKIREISNLGRGDASHPSILQVLPPFKLTAGNTSPYTIMHYRALEDRWLEYSPEAFPGLTEAAIDRCLAKTKAASGRKLCQL